MSLLTQSQSSYDELQQHLSSPPSPIKSNANSPQAAECSAAAASDESGAASSESNAEEYLRSIWRKLDVGKDGFLDIEELYRVCEHIGMLEINDEIIQQLFDKLDSDQDGKVSFDEFLEGLFQHKNTAPDNSPSQDWPVDSPPTSPTCSSQENQRHHYQEHHNHHHHQHHREKSSLDDSSLLPEHQGTLFSNTNSYLISLDPDKSG